jgi:hypothetical protein
MLDRKNSAFWHLSTVMFVTLRSWFLLVGQGTEAWLPGLARRAIWKEESMTKLLGKALAGATIGAGLLAMSTIGASAAIACRGNVCWHSHETYAYPPDAGVVVHEDNWRWGPRERFMFREHEGRGYWRGDRWTTW